MSLPPTTGIRHQDSPFRSRSSSTRHRTPGALGALVPPLPACHFAPLLDCLPCPRAGLPLG